MPLILVGEAAGERGPMHVMSRSTLAMLTFPALFAVSILVGRASRLEEGEVSLVWPATAVAIIWMLVVWHCTRRERFLHLGMLAAVTFAMHVLTRSPMANSAWFGLVNIVLVLVTVGILHYRRDVAVLRDPTDLARLVLAILAGSVCGATLATAYVVLVAGAPAWETFALITARNAASALVGVSAWLRLCDVRWGWPRGSVRDYAEALATTVVVVGVFVWVFWLNTGSPIAFLVILPSVYVTLRYTTTVATVFLAAASGWIIFATLSGKGTSDSIGRCNA